MHISVAICTYNRASLLEQTLDRLTLVDPPLGATWEVVVVDNGSTDGTADVLRRFSDRLPLRTAQEAVNGLSRARNRALEHVQGDYVLWTDDDVEVDVGWLRAFTEGARQFPDATVFGGPVAPWFPSPPDPDLLEAFPALALGFCGVDHKVPPGLLGPEFNINGANMAFHRGRTATLRFDPAFGPARNRAIAGDERNFIDRCRSVGGSVVWLPDMRVRHYVMPERMSLHYLLRYYHDYAMTTVRRDGPPPGVRLFGVPRWALREVASSALRITMLRPFLARREYLLALRSHHYYRGVVRECLTSSCWTALRR